MNSIPCSCGGENPNCFKCDGTGMVASAAQQLGRPHPPPGQIPLQKKRARRSRGQSLRAKSARPAGAALPSFAAPRKKKPQAAAPRIARVLVVCPECGASVRQLKKHYEKAHSPAAASRRLAVLRDSRSSPPSAKSHKQDTARQSVGQWPALDDPRDLDAKHGWGGSFRDNGQFGSYPSHDDMGDESTS
jgi:hypothetical protein